MLVSERAAEALNEDIVLVPDIWRDRLTGEIYGYDDFRGKRTWAFAWDAIDAALLCVVGTCFYIASAGILEEPYERKAAIHRGIIIWIAITALNGVTYWYEGGRL